MICCANLYAQSCLITGPSSVQTGVHVLYLGSLHNQNWEVYSYNGADAQIFHYNDDTLIVDTGPTAGNITVYLLGNPNYEVLCSLNVIIDAALPVEMSSFNSQVSGRNVALNWITTSEINNSGFQIERKASDETWKSISFVNGHNNSNEPLSYSYIDRNLQSGVYNYRIKQIDNNGNYRYYELQNQVVIGLPGRFFLHQNFPNPFNPSTKIDFEISAASFVRIVVFDINGKEIKTLVNEFRVPGFYSEGFDAGGLPGGIYFCKFEAGGFSSVMKMILVK